MREWKEQLRRRALSGGGVSQQDAAKHRLSMEKYYYQQIDEDKERRMSGRRRVGMPNRWEGSIGFEASSAFCDRGEVEKEADCLERMLFFAVRFVI